MTRAYGGDRVPGQFTVVLHSHLPWLAHHGRWPVGEEWLYQSWAASYQPLFAMLRRLGAEGFTDQLSLGVTPVLAAQLDDSHCSAGMHEWLGSWRLRAQEAAMAGGPIAAVGAAEFRAADDAIADFDTHWRHGGSAAIRPIIDAGVIELLGGPSTHGFAPLLDPRLRQFALAEGLADAHNRFGSAPHGIWAPECAYAPGMASEYDAAGVRHFMVDGPALRGDTALGHPVDGADAIAFGRDLTVTYRVWSPRSGYPGHADYRDFHTWDHAFGLKPARVTGRGVPGSEKAPYDPDRARAAVSRHAADFVDRVRNRLIEESARIGRDALVVAAFDTELFGHWWHEGPRWLDEVLRALPRAGVRVGTLATAVADGYVGAPVDLGPSSWGSGKDWRIWNGPAVADMVELVDDVTSRALATIDKRRDRGAVVRDVVSDQVLTEALLTAASDWAFMVSKESAADYARERAFTHAHATREICDAADGGRDEIATRLARQWQRADSPFGALDARRIPR